MDTLGKIFHVNFLECTHGFMSISISQLKDYYISVDQARYDISIVAKYIDTYTVEENSNFTKSALPQDMVFTK